MNTQVILMEVISKTNKLLNTIKSNGLIIEGITKIPILSETSISDKTNSPGIYYASVKLPDTLKSGEEEIVFDIQIIENVDGELENTFLKFKYSPYAERPYIDYMERLYLDDNEKEEKEK
jgi:hypothetical protein